MKKEKIEFKEYPLLHRVMLSTFYGLFALSAVITGFAIKNNKNVTNAVSTLGALALTTPLYHIAARNETRQMKQEQRD